jgi:hypothetical protein
LKLKVVYNNNRPEVKVDGKYFDVKDLMNVVIDVAAGTATLVYSLSDLSINADTYSEGL